MSAFRNAMSKLINRTEPSTSISTGGDGAALDVLAGTPMFSINAVSQHDIKRGKANISYKPELIKNLTSDHEELINLWLEINNALETKIFRNVRSLIDTFDHKFKGHVMNENLFLYAYLEDQLSKDDSTAVSLERARQIKDGMRPISSTVKTFCRKWKSTPINAANVSEFEHDFVEITSILNDRIELEETKLYPLYAPA